MLATNYNSDPYNKLTANNGRVNEIFLESQKMIYAPQSREKSKQTVRSPLIERQSSGGVNSD
jgi:hypothetical protein